MIKVINFTIKIILSLLTMFIWWINIIIVLIMWDGKFMVAHTLLDLIWDKPKQCDIHDVMPLFSESEIEKMAFEWSSERSIGDAEQDSQCIYDYTQGMRAMQRLLLNEA